MAQQSIRIPVELELTKIQQSINSLKSALSKVDPGTAIYKKLDKQLDRLGTRLIALQATARGTFSSTNQIQQFERNIQNLGMSIQTVIAEMGQIDFSELKVDPKSISGIRTLADNIVTLQNQIGSLKTDKMKELVRSSASLQEVFSNLTLNPDLTSFENASKQIETKVKDLQKQIEKHNKNLSERTLRRDRLTNQQTQLSSMGNIFENRNDSRFFTSGGNFKVHGALKVADWMKDLGFSSKVIEEVKTKKASELKAFYDSILKEVEARQKAVDNALTKTNEAILDEQNRKSYAEDAKNQYQSALTSLQGIDVDPKIKQVIADLENQIQEARVEIARLKQEYVEMSGPASDAAKASKDVSDGMEGVGRKTPQATAEIEKFNEQTQKLKNIQNAIKQWFGFREVVNITKSVIRGAIKDIRELDKAMTEIAVVTDMTQEQLWNQIGTYSNIAQQYGVSTAGVYEVSQLFYQQGFWSNT